MPLESAVGPRDWTSHPPYLYPGYRSTALRGPTRPLVPLRQTLSELTGPVYGHESVGPLDDDLTKNGAKSGEPLGERIIVTGRVLDEAGRPIRNTLIEIWQANAAGRYVHHTDQHDAPLDPNFFGGGRCVTDDERALSLHDRSSPAPIRGSTTTTPGGRTTSTSRSSGPPSRRGSSRRCIFRAIRCSRSTRSSSPRRKARATGSISQFSLDVTEPGFALGYVFDIVLRGPAETPMETQAVSLKQTPSQTVGPFFAFGLTAPQYGYPLRRDRLGRPRGRADAGRAHRDRQGGCSTARASRSPTR